MARAARRTNAVEAATIADGSTQHSGVSRGRWMEAPQHDGVGRGKRNESVRRGGDGESEQVGADVADKWGWPWRSERALYHYREVLA
jgi:hypothetical protein